MRYLSKIIVWLAIFFIVLAWRFPYELVFIKAIDSLKEQTKAQITWDELEANLFGAKLKNLQIVMPSGFKFSSDQAIIRPKFTGITFACTQTAKGGQAKLTMTHSSLELETDKLEADTGSNDIGIVNLSGNLAYTIANSAIKGELHLTIPSLSGALPIPLKNLEVGATIASDGTTSNNKNLTISNALTIYGEGLDGSGNVYLKFAQGSTSPSMNGELTVNAKGLGTHTIKLGGTWAQPQWNLAGAKK